MNVAKHCLFCEAVARAELVGVTFRGTGAVTRAKVRLVLQSTHDFANAAKRRTNIKKREKAMPEAK